MNATDKKKVTIVSVAVWDTFQ